MRCFRTIALVLGMLVTSYSAMAQAPGNLVSLTLSVPQTNQIYVADLNMQHIKSAGVLFSATLTSLSSTPIQVKLRMTINVTLADGESYPDIADATTEPFTLRPAQTKVITNVDLSGDNPTIAVEDSHYDPDKVEKLRDVSLATGKAPAGVYQFILVCLNENNVEISRPEYGRIAVTNPSRIELALPIDEGNVSTLFPHFQWLSNVDTVMLAVYEKLPSQQTPEDVVSGVPFLRVTVPNSTSPGSGSFNYPPSGPGVRPLEEGRTYYWYVEVPSSSSRGSGIRSDIWSFTVGGMDSAAFTGTGVANINSMATETLKRFLSGTSYQNLIARIGLLTGQATYDGSAISTQELIEILNSIKKSEVTKVTIQ